MNMATGEFAARQAELQTLLADPRAGPDTLETAAWDVIGGVLFEPRSDESVARDQLLLPTARALLQRNLDHPELAAAGDDRYFNARIAIAVWGILGKLSRGQELEPKTRNTSIRNLSLLASDATGGSFAIDELDQHPATKVREAVALGLAIRGNRGHQVTFGVPSPPFTHARDYYDADNGTSSFQIYIGKDSILTPTYVTSRNREGLQTTGVLAFGVGELLMSAATKIEGIMQRSKQQGTLGDGQRWLTNLAARLLAEEPGGITADHRGLLNRAGGNLSRMVDNYRRQVEAEAQRQTDGGSGVYTTSSWDNN